MNEIALRVPEYDQDQFSKRYGELAQYHIDLPEDPVALGFHGINRLYSQAYAMSERLDEVEVESDRMVAQAEAALIALQSAFEAKMDAKVAAAPKGEYESIKIVEAKARVDLAEDLKATRRAKLVLGLLKTYRRAVQGRGAKLERALKLLENLNNNLKRQLPPAPGQR